jgi:hypothetical protein
MDRMGSTASRERWHHSQSSTAGCRRKVAFNLHRALPKQVPPRCLHISWIFDRRFCKEAYLCSDDSCQYRIRVHMTSTKTLVHHSTVPRTPGHQRPLAALLNLGASGSGPLLRVFDAPLVPIKLPVGSLSPLNSRLWKVPDRSVVFRECRVSDTAKWSIVPCQGKYCMALWRNGSALVFGTKGLGFESLRGHIFATFWLRIATWRE